MKRFNDKDSFVNLSNILHKNKYDYSLFDYKGKSIKGEIIYPIHGSFWQTPNLHNRKERPSGCPKCAAENKSISFSEFVKRAKKIHGDNYVYKKEDYANMPTPMRMFCKKHDKIFNQMPSLHVHKTSPTKCPLCAAEIVINKNRNSFDEFVMKACELHKDKYIYDESKFVNSITKINMYCRKCDSWSEQTPHSHLEGRGCPRCKNSKLEETVGRELDKINLDYIPQKTFDWLKYKKKQYLDFYLPKYNIAIECQGEQHFMPIDFSNAHNHKSAMSKYELNCLRDKNKFNLCKNHDIRVFYINYDENVTERIKEILTKFQKDTIYSKE